MKPYNGFSPRARRAALTWLKREYAAGRRTPPTVCDACGQHEGVIDAHSEDYSTPFGDHIGRYALCYRCHMAVHCRFGRGWRQWDVYRRLIAAGAVLRPFYTRSFGRFAAEHLAPADPSAALRRAVVRWRHPPTRLILHEIAASAAGSRAEAVRTERAGRATPLAGAPPTAGAAEHRGDVAAHRPCVDLATVTPSPYDAV